MSNNDGHDFLSRPAETLQTRLKELNTSQIIVEDGDNADGDNDEDQESDVDAALADSASDLSGSPEWVHMIKPLYLGLAALRVTETHYKVGYSVHDGVYSIDFAVHSVDLNYPHLNEAIASRVLERIKTFSNRHLTKFVAVGLTTLLVKLCPYLPSLLWAQLDILPFVFPAGEFDKDVSVDELADAAVRKAVMWIGPKELPRLSIIARNMVDPDAGGIQICQLEDYKASVHEVLWRCVTKFGDQLKERKTKVAFFSATPQGGGVALMRHSLIRFFRLLGVHVTWYIPKPRPSVFRITKTNHNILQGVADPSTRISDADKAIFSKWINTNAERYWLSKGGPLAAGGADVVMIDDPQMVGLIPLIKKTRRSTPVVYRSHIEIRSDLTSIEGSPQAEVWQFLWNSIQHCDVFIAHPVAGFVPSEVPHSKVGMMPATTDWLDGLNKPMADWDLQYYMRNFAQLCDADRMSKLAFPARGYICQVARFDPSKGIPDVIESYCKLRQQMGEANIPLADTPQLLICGHGAIDDPDGTVIYDETCKSLDKKGMEGVKDDIVVMRLGPSDQMLNALLSNSKIALQLSHREGFEVKVSEALHKSIPIVAYDAGGIPLQIRHGVNGFLVPTGDTDGVAKHLFDLWMNVDGLYNRMQKEAKGLVSDEVSTVGNAAVWAYLASTLARGEKVEPNGKWVYDMMRTAAGEPFQVGETRLPRIGIEVQK